MEKYEKELVTLEKGLKKEEAELEAVRITLKMIGKKPVIQYIYLFI